MLSKLAAAGGVALLSACFLYGPLTVKLLLVLLTLVSLHQLKRPPGIPHGPRGVPILGYVPFIGMRPYLAFHELSKKYGSIFSLYMGPKLSIVVNDYRTAKEILDVGDLFAARPDDQGGMVGWEETRVSILATHGPYWKEHRRFALSTLRDFGIGRSSLEPALLDEICRFMKELEKSGGEPFDIMDPLGLSICNNICILEFGKRFEYDDPTFQKLKHHVDDVARYAAFDAFFALFGPWILKLPFINSLDGASKMRDATEGILSQMRKTVAERKKTYVPGSKTDYIDAYFTERIEREKTKNFAEFFDDKALHGNLELFYVAGTETTTTVIRHLFRYLMMHLDVQRKVQQEIDDVIGRERLPSMEDRNRMPYTDAVMLESQRMGCVVPVNAPHSCVEDVTIGGYTIPKGTGVFANIYGIHRDETLFQDPFSFRPERFINAEGKFVKHEAVMPFGIGKRYCPGEPLGRMEVFLYLTSILQKFNLVNPENQVLTNEVEGTAVCSPIHYFIKFVPRAQ